MTRADSPALRETERRRDDTSGLDLRRPYALVQTLIAAHADIPAVVSAAAPATVEAVEGTVARMREGGRLVFAGSGTPGLLAEADAGELAPTFGFPAERLAVIRAGIEVAEPGVAPDEDCPGRGAAAVTELALSSGDVVVAVASSGSTPYTVGAARQAASAGAFVVAVTNVRESPLAATASVSVVMRTGAEPVMGSTRMRAGLSQRLWLTVFSTAVMVRLGLTYDNLMVNVAPALAKLRQRRLTILSEATGLGSAEVPDALDAAGDDLRTAIVMVLAGATRVTAETALRATGGRVRQAIALARS